MRIRTCEDADIDQVAQIFCKAYSASPYNESWKAKNASAYLR